MIEKLAFLNHNRNLMHPINREKMYWFFREQFRFGHRDVLLDYLGLDYSYLIEGFLQHGVHINERVGYWPYQELPKSFSKFYPSFVWSKQAEISAIAKGHQHVTAIGAPWLYLLSNLGYFSQGKIKNVSIHKPLKELLVVPSHGSGHSYANSNYGKTVESVRKRIGDVNASVLLYYTEFSDPKIREIWTRNGFTLECSGFAWGAEHRTLWTYNGGRPEFLQNTLNVLLNHGEVLCTSPTTLATYSTSLGIPTSILIDPEISIALGIVNEGKGVENLRNHNSRISELSNHLLGGEFANRNITEDKIRLAFNYLGIESFQSSDRLRNTLPLIGGVIPVPSQE